ncbi:MAG: RHS repeat-associated core domain-containing protein [Pirellula sp.]|jgi:RHS repeat-associated protein|nr:RHS repeat-associated core domain-containing protein [Pirellula sp.]
MSTPASPSLASPLTDAALDSIKSITTSFAASVEPKLETTTVTEVALGYHRNQQYTLTAMTTSTGAVAERFANTAYGQPTSLNASGSPIGNQQSQIANRFTYTGREWDETLGLRHFRARWMSPLAGSFLGRDPIGYEDVDHLYALSSSSPLGRMDPLGTDSLSPDEQAALKGCACAATNQSKLPKGAYGWVECKGGTFAQIVAPPATVGNSNCFTKSGIDKCIKEHEEHHVEQSKNLCPNACEDRCGMSIDGYYIGFSSDECRNKTECYAHKVEMECLNRLYWEHLDKERSNVGVSCTFLNPYSLSGQPNVVKCSGNIKNWWWPDSLRIATNSPSHPKRQGYGCNKKIFPPFKPKRPKA